MAPEIFERMPPPKRAHVIQFVIKSMWKILRSSDDPKLLVDSMRLIVTLLPSILGITLPIGSAIAFLLKPDLWKALGSHRELRTALLVSLGISIVASISVFVDRWLLKRRLLYADANRNLSIIQLSAGAQIISEREIIWAYRFYVQCKSKCRKFYWSFSWVKPVKEVDNCFDVTLLNSNHSYAINMDPLSLGNFIEIDLGREMSNRDTEIIEFFFRAVYEDGIDILPSLSISVPSSKYPKFNTHIILSFPDSLKPVTIYRQEYYTAFNHRPLTSRAFSGSTFFEWTLPVRQGWRYCARWVWGP